MRLPILLCAMYCSCHHELETARINGLLGNIDANTGDPQTGTLSLLESHFLGSYFFN